MASFDTANPRSANAAAGFDRGALSSQQCAMTSSPPDSSDSPASEGGTIPGSAGHPAYRLTNPTPSPIPIAIAVPHAGRNYPARLVERMRSPDQASLKLEDRHADRLAAAVAKQRGAR